MIIGSDNTEFFQHIYTCKTRHKLSSEVFICPKDEMRENVLDEKNPKRSKYQRMSTFF